MSKAETLYEAIDSIDDKYVVEAFEYKKKRPVLNIIAAVAACLCICVAIQSIYNTGYAAPVTVYAYGSGQEIGWKKPTLMEGTISDDGEMHGTPLQFYVSEKSIEKIRFSVKNQYLSFWDWTDKREDYGYSKSVTVKYGDEDDYEYLIIYWEPEHLIRLLTDHEDIGITDLPEEDRKDMIVMQITYESGKEETCAIHINLTDDGKFEAEVVPYKITDSDTFVLHPETENVPAYGTGEDAENYGSKDTSAEEENYRIEGTLSEKTISEITAFAKEWYASHSYEVISITPDYDETERQEYDYKEYNADAILVFRVAVKGDEVKRYITIGSRNDWQDCDVLNEGY